ncbi:MAG: hypothetical protein RhofKO_37020 [Rhodothermales bacterium]
MLLRFLIGLLLSVGLAACQQEALRPTVPEVFDANLQLELVAEQPDLQTPIGLAIDANDVLYVLESHTHSPPDDYEGPPGDRIKRGVDSDGDSIPDAWSVFAEGFEDGMNLAIANDGTVFLTTKRRVVALSDVDGDGVSDVERTLAEMVEPDYVYDHAGILGLALGADGWVYVSRGNTGSAGWRIEAADGSSLSGYGDGGNVFRLRPDGSRLEALATGFWNPFGLTFAADGRLLLTDNDPDGRGPNRLIEVVPGGDYGYHSLYGGSGLHPYLAWNGERPGMLPYAAALGEAPCAVLDATATRFGATYAGAALAAVWEENAVVRVPLQAAGSTVVGEAEPLVQGGADFHPVGLAANSRGDVYITDWAMRQYPNHGKGRLWRLSARTPSAPLSTPRPAVDRFAASALTGEGVIQALTGGDVFEQTLARRQVRKTASPSEVAAWFTGSDAALRLQALLIHQEAAWRIPHATLERLLVDENRDIRRMALVYSGQQQRMDLAGTVDQALASGHIGPELFETYLATVRHLQPGFIEAYQARSEPNANRLSRPLPNGFIEGLLADSALPEVIRAQAIPHLGDPASHRDSLLVLLAAAQSPGFQVGLIRALSGHGDSSVDEPLRHIALHDAADDAVRAQAVGALLAQDTELDVGTLLADAGPLTQYAAVRYACARSLRIDEDLLDEHLEAVWTHCTKRSEPDDAAYQRADQPGDAARGRIVFESAAARCMMCHRVDGWGSIYGPDLSNVGGSKTRALLVSAILEPSAEIAPEWQGWYVVDQEGTTHTGRQIDVLHNRVELMDETGDFIAHPTPQGFGVWPASLMPEGLHRALAPAEFQDLIAYLESLN